MASHVQFAGQSRASSRRLVEHFTDPDTLEDLTLRGFSPLRVVNCRRNPEGRRLATLLAIDPDRYTVVPAQMPQESVVCVEGLVCLYSRRDGNSAEAENQAGRLRKVDKSDIIKGMTQPTGPRRHDVETWFEDASQTVAYVALEGENRLEAVYGSRMTYEVISGVGTFCVNGEVIPVQGGDTVVIPPGVPYQDESNTGMVMLCTSEPPFNPATVEIFE